MNRPALLVGLACLLIALLLARAATAQTSTGYDLAWHVLAGGGTRATSAGFAWDATLGQWAAGPADDTNCAVNSGYWQRWLGQQLYLPLVLRQ